MKATIKGFVCVFMFVALAASAHAQSPREQLKQMVEQLQKAPGDKALREKIITLALTIKPVPALPPEAERRMARGSAAFEGATSARDYQNAAKEFEQATMAAPWYGDAYYNLGVAQDKAEDYDSALRSLSFAALASPGSKDARKLSYAVEFRKEKTADPITRAARQKLKDEALIANLDGAIFTRMLDPEFEKQYRISKGRVVYWSRTIDSYRCPCGVREFCDGTRPTSVEHICDFSVPLDGRRASYGVPDGWNMTLEVAEDGQSLLMREAARPGGTSTDYVYRRR